jgi:asparagine synthase (glutamine-hydrolysing)
MVGICGVVGGSDGGVTTLAEGLVAPKRSRRTTHVDDGIAVHVASHPQFHEEQPATTGDGSLVWVYGEPYGFETVGGYDPRSDPSTPDAEYCADLYDEHGIDFVSGLNGEFAGVVFDRRRRRTHLFTSRMGARPLFYTHADGALLFSSSVQSIGLHPDVTPTFDRESLAEFFGVQKPFGTATVLTDVWQVRPASVYTVGADGSVRGRRTYWRPEYRPVERSSAELARTTVETVRRVFEERVREDLDYGVLLSGGSDSRLVLGSMTERGRTPTAFHLTSWENRERRAAERVASVSDVEFRALERDEDYHATLLDRVPRFSNFVGVFDESVATGFEEELRSVDVLLTGYLGDTMFGTYPLYFAWTPLPFDVPLERRVPSVSEYVDRYLSRYDPPARTPEFLDAPPVGETVCEHLTREDGAVSHHGVTYPSLREVQLCEYYPLTNQYAFANSESLFRVAGHWSPFFDNRLVDLHLSVPVRDRFRYDVVDLAVSRQSPSLAAIPDAHEGIPLDASTRFGPVSLLRRVMARARQRLTDDPPPEEYLGHGSWVDESKLIRNHDFVEATLERNGDLIDVLPFLDRAGVDRHYRDHLDGADNWQTLYALVTLLETPLAKSVAAEHR